MTAVLVAPYENQRASELFSFLGWTSGFLVEDVGVRLTDEVLQHRELIAQEALGILPFTGLLILVPVLNGHVEVGGVTIAVVLKHRGGHATTGGT